MVLLDLGRSRKLCLLIRVLSSSLGQLEIAAYKVGRGIKEGEIAHLRGSLLRLLLRTSRHRSYHALLTSHDVVGSSARVCGHALRWGESAFVGPLCSKAGGAGLTLSGVRGSCLLLLL